MLSTVITVIKEKYEEDDNITAGELLSIFETAEKKRQEEEIKMGIKLRQQLP